MSFELKPCPWLKQCAGAPWPSQEMALYKAPRCFSCRHTELTLEGIVEPLPASPSGYEAQAWRIQ